MLKSETFAFAVAILASSSIATHVNQGPAAHPTMLAQVGYNFFDQYKSHCNSAHERIKHSEDIFYQKQGGAEEYIDETFPLETMVRDEEHPSAVGDLSGIVDKIKWIDSIDIRFSESEYSLYGEEYPKTGHATDIY